MSAPPPDDPQQPPAGPGGKLGVVDYFLRLILGYMSTPWRALTVIVLLLLAGLAFGLWTERDAVRELIAAPKPVVLKSDVSGPIDDLLNHTDVDAVMVWAVDLTTNTAYFRDGKRRGGGLWAIQPNRLPAIADKSDPRGLAQMLAGHPWCDGLPKVATVLRDQLITNGIEHSCIVPIKPGPSQPLIGAIVLGWKAVPKPPYQQAALTMAEVEATRLLMR